MTTIVRLSDKKLETLAARLARSTRAQDRDTLKAVRAEVERRLRCRQLATYLTRVLDHWLLGLATVSASLADQVRDDAGGVRVAQALLARFPKRGRRERV